MSAAVKNGNGVGHDSDFDQAGEVSILTIQFLLPRRLASMWAGRQERNQVDDRKLFYVIFPTTRRFESSQTLCNGAVYSVYSAQEASGASAKRKPSSIIILTTIPLFQQQRASQMTQALSLMSRLYIGSVSFEIREDNIRQMFSVFGPIKSFEHELRHRHWSKFILFVASCRNEIV